MRKCECGRVADHVNGYYLVGPRRVRVWACMVHAENIGLMPTPADVLAGMKADEEYYAEMEKLYRTTIVSGRSIRTLAPSGHGQAVANGQPYWWVS